MKDLTHFRGKSRIPRCRHFRKMQLNSITSASPYPYHSWICVYYSHLNIVRIQFQYVLKIQDEISPNFAGMENMGTSEHYPRSASIDPNFPKRDQQVNVERLRQRRNGIGFEASNRNSHEAYEDDEILFENLPDQSDFVAPGGAASFSSSPSYPNILKEASPGTNSTSKGSSRSEMQNELGNGLPLSSLPPPPPSSQIADYEIVQGEDEIGSITAQSLFRRQHRRLPPRQRVLREDERGHICEMLLIADRSVYAKLGRSRSKVEQFARKLVDGVTETFKAQVWLKPKGTSI